jgi:hypothetical protein
MIVKVQFYRMGWKSPSLLTCEAHIESEYVHKFSLPQTLRD